MGDVRFLIEDDDRGRFAGGIGRNYHPIEGKPKANRVSAGTLTPAI